MLPKYIQVAKHYIYLPKQKIEKIRFTVFSSFECIEEVLDTPEFLLYIFFQSWKQSRNFKISSS